jgi:hypothetical protein
VSGGNSDILKLPEGQIFQHLKQQITPSHPIFVGENKAFLLYKNKNNKYIVQ